MNFPSRTSHLLARYGLQLSDLLVELPGNVSKHGILLRQALLNAGTTIEELGSIPESKWQEALRQACLQVERMGGEGLVDPRSDELPLADIDFYLKGVIRWMNALGIYTRHCCDGHGDRMPFAGLQSAPTPEQMHLLRVCAPEGVAVRIRGTRVTWEMNPAIPHLLLDMAHRLYSICREPAMLDRYEADRWAESLTQLLNVPGVSGQERYIRQIVRARLKPLADDLFVDRAGNVCATIRMGGGPVVLLCAHMDVYSEIAVDQRIVREGTVLSSSHGILGADDRAGIAVILEVCRRIRETNFRGTLKVAFTVQEEVGLVGARKLDAAFLEDVNAAIVADRRGTRDIVTSCRGAIPFCRASYGERFEQAGAAAGMPDWQVASGGSSDAAVLAEQFGIETVNLSVGYRNEHTDQESLDYLAAYQTVKLIETALDRRMLE